MTDYILNLYDLEYKGPVFIRNDIFKVKHFRQWKGREVSAYGGYTAIFHQKTGMVFSSKCRDDEQFSHRKGLLTCIQKALSCPPFFGQQGYWHNRCKSHNWIYEWKFGENSIDVQICEVNPEHRWSWLTKRL